MTEAQILHEERGNERATQFRIGEAKKKGKGKGKGWYYSDTNLGWHSVCFWFLLEQPHYMTNTIANRLWSAPQHFREHRNPCNTCIEHGRQPGLFCSITNIAEGMGSPSTGSSATCGPVNHKALKNVKRPRTLWIHPSSIYPYNDCSSSSGSRKSK